VPIRGLWGDDYGTAHTIDEWSWSMISKWGDSLFHVSQADIDSSWLVAENDKANSHSASQWSKFDWTWDGDGTLYYCQSSFDAGSEADAVKADSADAADLKAGCAGWSWTALWLAE